MRITTFIPLIVLFLQSCSPSTKPFWPEEKSPEKIYRKVSEDLLARKNYMMYRTQDVWAVHYSEVCAAFGAARVAGYLGDTAILEALSERYMKVITDSIGNTANHVDANVYGILPLELWKHTGHSAFLEQGMFLADSQWEDPLPNGLTRQTRFWIDDIWMYGSLQVQAWRVTEDKKYLDLAALETVAYLEKLQRPNGLFFHGENAPFHWGRGNGWVAAGLVEILSELPEDHEYYPTLLKGYQKMMQALLKFQAKDGMWRQLINEEISWKETSCTGMFGYAMAMGVKKGLLPRDPYEKAYQKAWLSLTDYLQNDGRLNGVCVGTGQSTDMQFYLDRPRITGDFHGQAPLLWFVYALLII